MEEQNTFECPVCYEALVSPIFQCFNGHLICNSCISRVRKCPVCRERLARRKIRNLEIERIVSTRPFVCSFTEQGCQDNTRHVGLDCPFASLNFCSFLGFRNCQEVLSRQEILAHLAKGHGVLVDESFSSLGDVIKVYQSASDMLDLDCIKPLWPPVAFGTSEGQLFILRTRVVRERVKWDVLVLEGKGIVASEFSLRISLHNDEKSARELLLPAWLFPDETYDPSISPMDSNLECGGSSVEPAEEAKDHLDDLEDCLRDPSIEVEDLWRRFSSAFEDEGKWLLKVTVVKKPEELKADETRSAGSWLNSKTVVSVQEVPPQQLSNLWRGRSTEDYDEYPQDYDDDDEEEDERWRRGDRDIFHETVQCDVCDVSPVVGRRYKCLDCPDFDLCAECVATQSHNHPHGLFLMSFFQRQRPQLRASADHIQSNLATQTFEDEPENSSQAHAGVGCDACNRTDFEGPRHKCVTRRDYDLCRTCIRSTPHSHALFLVALYPINPEKMKLAFRCARESLLLPTES